MAALRQIIDPDALTCGGAFNGRLNHGQAEDIVVDFARGSSAGPQGGNKLAQGAVDSCTVVL